MKVKCKDKTSCFKIIFNGVLSAIKEKLLQSFSPIYIALLFHTIRLRRNGKVLQCLIRVIVT